MKADNEIESQKRSITLLREELQECVKKIRSLTYSKSNDHKLLESVRAEADHLGTLLEEHLTEERIQLMDVVQPLWVPNGSDDENQSHGIADDGHPPLTELASGSIVVVDDDPTFSAPLVQQLQRDGYKCIEFQLGAEALLYLAEHPCQMILLDVLMQDMSGREVLERIKNTEFLKDTPVIMTAQRHELDHIAGSIHEGAEDFLAKPYNPTIVRARVASSIQRKELRERERSTFNALVKSQQQLAAELAEAAEYVTSLLPDRLITPVASDWRYIPSSQLGGDSFGYHWIDNDHLAIYLLDVCGHGVGAALLSVSVLNFLRSGTLPANEARHPSSVLGRLNATFLMERHNDMYFSLWYGVYNARTLELDYASGGHPPAILITGEKVSIPLSSRGTVIGALESLRYKTERVSIPAGSRLYVFSDGVYEIERPNQTIMGYDEFSQLLSKNDPEDGLDGIVATVRAQQANAIFDDDFSLMEFHFLQATPTSREFLTLHNSMDEWGKLLRFTQEFSFHHGISKEDHANIDVILEEVVTNILKYAGLPSDAEACTIELILDGSLLKIIISDSGTPFNPLLLPEVDTDKAIEDRPIGGLGIHFVKKLTISQDYGYLDGQNVLTLVKELFS
jgi:sigma-B regulation protein RsbU (phosphoserine phosphatase)